MSLVWFLFRLRELRLRATNQHYSRLDLYLEQPRSFLLVDSPRDINK
jgi:hypothetical protein